MWCWLLRSLLSRVNSCWKMLLSGLFWHFSHVRLAKSLAFSLIVCPFCHVVEFWKKEKTAWAPVRCRLSHISQVWLMCSSGFTWAQLSRTKAFFSVGIFFKVVVSFLSRRMVNVCLIMWCWLLRSLLSRVNSCWKMLLSQLFWHFGPVLLSKTLTLALLVCLFCHVVEFWKKTNSWTVCMLSSLSRLTMFNRCAVQVLPGHNRHGQRLFYVWIFC